MKWIPIIIALIPILACSVLATKDYTYNSVEECQEGMCTLSLYLGTQFVEEDGIWKSIDEARSLKGSGIECVVVKEKDGDPDAECIDYNLTSVTVAIHNRKGIEIPVHYQQKGVATDDLEGRERWNSTVVHPKADNELFTFPLLPDEVLHLGDESTTISLIDSTFKREFGTTFTDSDWPDYSFGDYTNNYVCNYSDHEHRMFIKINTSKIPIASAILSANLSMKVYRPIYSPKTVNVTLHRIYNNYTIEKKEWLTGHQNGLQADEFDMTWNRMPSNLFFDPVPGSSHLFISTDRFWVRWDITSMLQHEIDQNNRDFSMLALADPLTDPCDDYYYLTLYSEEYVSNAPYLTVEYTNFTNFTSYLYDYAGNLIRDSEYYYQYNSYNQLERVRINNASGTVLEEYFYDENGDRAIKIHHFNSTVNETVYYYGDFVRVVNASGVFDTVEFYHGDKLIAERKNDSTMLFFHPDHLGSTSLITNSTGGVVEETFYEPFGAVISGGNQSRFDYTGKETDDTGLEYFGARYYYPGIEKWTQPDTLIQYVYDPQSLNRYAFVRNNPYRYTDPTGRWAVTIGRSGEAGGSLGVGAGFGFTFSDSPESGIFIGTYEEYGGGAYGGIIADINAVDIMVYPEAKSGEELDGLGFSYSGQAYAEFGGGFSVDHDIEDEINEDSTFNDLIKAIGKKPIGYGIHGGVGQGAAATAEVKRTHIQGVYVNNIVDKGKSSLNNFKRKSTDFFVEAHKKMREFASQMAKAKKDYEKKMNDRYNKKK
jgi:RHS repeat-associated protein